MQDLSIYTCIASRMLATMEIGQDLEVWDIRDSQYREAHALAKKTKLVATSLGSPGRPRLAFCPHPSICWGSRVST
jgi:hypothetical protein